MEEFLSSAWEIIKEFDFTPHIIIYILFLFIIYIVVKKAVKKGISQVMEEIELDRQVFESFVHEEEERKQKQYDDTIL